MPLRLARPLALCLAFGISATVGRAEPSVSVRTEPLPVSVAGELPSAMPPPPAVRDLALRALGAPLFSIRQPGHEFALVRGGAGGQRWVEHLADAWVTRASPPAEMLGVAQALGQSHVLCAAQLASDRLRLYSYDIVGGQWLAYGEAVLPGRLISLAGAGNGFNVLSQGAGGRTVATAVTLVVARRGLTAIDDVAIAVYLTAVAGIGLYFYLRETRDTEQFFLADRKIPWWAAGISLYATGTSAISFIAIPAKAYATDWLYLGQNIVGIFGTIYVAIVIVPLMRRLNLTSVYEYLELRFHPIVRSAASALCILQHLASRMSIVLLLPALAISAVTGLSVVLCILLMGLITTLYTLLGGMKAVIWTDVLQVTVMLGGAFLALCYLVHGAGGIGPSVHAALADHKLHLFDFSFNFTIPNFWIFILLAVVQTLTWPQDQVMMQRVLATKDDRAAGFSIWMLTLLVIPGSVLFFALGTGLYVFYHAHPAELNPLLVTDQTFPHFIATTLPPGVTGVIIAGMFAASMAALASNINSVATLVSVDFYERFRTGATAGGSVRLAEWITVAAGALGTALALLFSFLNLQSLWDGFIAFWSLFGGGLAGVYALGMFTRRTNWQGAIAGILCASAVLVLVKLYTPIHVLMYFPIAVFTCMIVGWLGSFAFPRQRRSLVGLTVYDPVPIPPRG